MGEVVYPYPDLNPHVKTPEYRVRLRVVYDENYDIKILQAVPDFSEARCVIGLDAFPTEPKWEANTLTDIGFDRILSEEEEHQWRRNERQLEIVQVGSNKNTWTWRGFNPEKVSGLCAELRHQFGDSFSSGITSNEFESELRDEMRGAGINDPLTTHYGMEKSVDTFSGKEVGLVAGCISPSSEQIKDWLALLEKDATPKREVYDEYVGQDWIGPDASIAEELLADVREKHVLQAVGRYARDPDDPKDGALVYVLTNVLPEEWVDRHINDAETLAEKEREILSVLADASDGLTRRKLADKVEASKKHVCDTLEKCRGSEWLQVAEGAGFYNADVFYATRCPNCFVELLD
jgi:hypothetical protein